MPTPQQTAKIFDTALDTRKFEIGLFWQRSLFFWGFIAAAFVAYAEVVKEPQHDNDIALAIASFGVVCSVAAVTRGDRHFREVPGVDIRQRPPILRRYQPARLGPANSPAGLSRNAVWR